MADAYTTSLRFNKPEEGANEDTWGADLNNETIAMAEEAIAGQVSVSVTSGNVTLSTNNGTTDQHRPALLILTGTPGTTRTVTFPNVKKLTWVFNNSDSAATLTAGAGTTATMQPGAKALVYSDGATNIAMLVPDAIRGGFTVIIDGGGLAITTGVKFTIEMPYTGQFDSVTALADQTGSIVVDLWKDTYANYPPTDDDSITASAPITISSATKSTDSTLSGWIKTFTRGDLIRFNVDSCSSITRCEIAFRTTRT